MTSTRATIIGIGHCVPPRTLDNYDLEKMVDTSDTWIQERTGIVKRHICDVQTATSDLAIGAARHALVDAHVKPAEVELIIVATATPDMAFPATACIVQEAIGAKNAAAFDMEIGCSGFVYAIATGSQFIASGMYRKVLVIGADTLSKVTNFQDRNTCVLFGDGAGAVVLEPAPEGYGLKSFNLRADGSGAHLLRLAAGGSRKPASPDTIARGEHFIHMAGSEVFKFAVKVLAESTLTVVSAAGLTMDDVDLFVPHQANQRIMTTAARRINIPDEKVFSNVAHYGNTSCASIPIALSEAFTQQRIARGSTVVICGFGAGLGWGGACMRWSYTRPHPPVPELAAPACKQPQAAESTAV